jgi:hypothetical protein
LIVERLWLPPSHWLRARKRNFAISGWALIASSVANIVAVSTPLRTVSVITVSVIGFSSSGWSFRHRERCRAAARRPSGKVTHLGRPLYLDRVGAVGT